MAVKSLIETVTVGAGGAASIEFTGIPQDGVDLVLLLSGRTDYSGVGRVVYTTINSDNSTTYQNRLLRGDGSAASSQIVSNTLGIYAGFIDSASATSNTFENLQMYVSNYAGSSQKSFSLESVSENNATEAYQNIVAGLWPQTAAITSIKMTPLSANFVEHSTASLYKIKYD